MNFMDFINFRSQHSLLQEHWRHQWRTFLAICAFTPRMEYWRVFTKSNVLQTDRARISESPKWSNTEKIINFAVRPESAMHKIYSRQNIEISRHHRSLWHRTAMHWETKRALTNACLAWRSAEAPADPTFKNWLPNLKGTQERLKQDEHMKHDETVLLPMWFSSVNPHYQRHRASQSVHELLPGLLEFTQQTWAEILIPKQWHHVKSLHELY